MRDVLFYDFDFNVLADYPRFISLNIDRNYCGFGTAELHFSLKDSEIIDLLESNPYLFFVAGENSAIVTGWRIEEDIAIFGRTPEWLLTKRGLEPFSQSAQTPEEIVRAAVTSAAGDFLTLGELSEVGTSQDYSTDKVRVLHDVVCEVLKAQNLGFKVVADVKTKQFIFSVFSGTEKQVVLSPSNRTAYDMQYTVEKQDAVSNSGWFLRKLVNMGEWSASANSPKLTNGVAGNAFTYYKITTASSSQFGLTCVKGEYLYCDSRDGVWKTSADKPTDAWDHIENSDLTGARKWEAVLSGTKTEAEAAVELAQLTKKESSAAQTKSVVYGEDYLLGDIVRVQVEFGDFKKAEKKRITSVSIYYDVDKSGVVPTFNSLEE